VAKIVLAELPGIFGAPGYSLAKAPGHHEARQMPPGFFFGWFGALSMRVSKPKFQNPFD
jgi:hypothetical protein